MGDQSDKSRLISEYCVAEYKCGLRAGDIVELKKPLIVHDHQGTPTGHVHPAGEVWIVLSGSKDDPGVIWFRQPDGQRHTWDDDPAQIDEWFRRVAIDEQNPQSATIDQPAVLEYRNQTDDTPRKSFWPDKEARKEMVGVLIGELVLMPLFGILLIYLLLRWFR